MSNGRGDELLPEPALHRYAANRGRQGATAYSIPGEFR